MATVICCGAATLDTIFRVERMPTGPGKILPTGMIEVAHGMATSAAAAVARLGGRARLFARVGDDLAGQRFIRDLTEAGVDCTYAPHGLLKNCRFPASASRSAQKSSVSTCGRAQKWCIPSWGKPTPPW